MYPAFETILIDGYTVKIYDDQHPDNLWEMEQEPPIMVYYLNSTKVKDYGTNLNLLSIYNRIPMDMFHDPETILEALGVSKNHLDYIPDSPEGWKEVLGECLPESPTTWTPTRWSDGTEYFKMTEALCKLLGIPCHYEVSRGFSQGDSAHVLLAALPEWLQKDERSSDIDLKSSFNLWAEWSWEGVFGYELIGPDGNEIDSTWGFYGTDWVKNNLIDSVKDMIQGNEWVKNNSSQ